MSQALIAAYPQDDERPHAVGEPPFWQESVVIFWWDDKAGIGGFQRIGHEPYFQGGKEHLWSFVFFADGRRHRNHGSVPAHPPRGRERFTFDNRNEMHVDGSPVWRIGVHDLEIQMTVEDFFQAQDSWPRNSGTLSAQVAKGHTECAGRARGWASIRGSRLDIDALCGRDHSWGQRDWSKLRNHIWFAGSCGPGLSFSGIDFFATDGSHVRNAILFYDGAHDNETRFEVTHDGDERTGELGGGTLALHRRNGKPLAFRFECVDGGCTLHQGYLLYDYICRLRGEDGSTGYLAFEWSRRHDRPEIPAEMRLAAINGWSQKPLSGNRR